MESADLGVESPDMAVECSAQGGVIGVESADLAAECTCEIAVPRAVSYTHLTLPTSSYV